MRIINKISIFAGSILFIGGMDSCYVIPLNGLACGKSQYEWVLDKLFFISFENEEILDAEVLANVLEEKAGRKVNLDCTLAGHITVACDRCLEPVEMPVRTEFRLALQYDEEESIDDDREVIVLEGDSPEYDLSQVLYDYSCLALPLQRVHPDGQCNPESMKYLQTGAAEETEEVFDNPFAALKGMFEN